jgi:Ca2+-transporting ATPase
LEGQTISVDESALTGDARASTKDSYDPFLYSTCSVVDGHAKMVIVAVGENTRFHSMARLIELVPEITPLHERMSLFAAMIGKFGWVSVAVVFTQYMARFVLARRVTTCLFWR